MWPSAQSIAAALAAATARLAPVSTWPVAVPLSAPAPTPWPNAASITTALARAGR